MIALCIVLFTQRQDIFMIDPKTKVEYLTELVVKIFDIKLNVEHILTKYLSLY
jgi:hypothetical protein